MGSQYTSFDIATASSKWEDLSGNRIKFLCSYGGQFLPRPSDGQLRYVGGETRLVTVDRSITFQDFMKKLEDVFDTMSVNIKYQLPMLDLDVLISVKCDEDLQNMMDEYDRHDSHRENSPCSRLKAFLFPQTTPLPSVENQMSPKQRYIDAVNGLAPNLVKQKKTLITIVESSRVLFRSGIQRTNRDRLSIPNRPLDGRSAINILPFFPLRAKCEENSLRGNRHQFSFQYGNSPAQSPQLSQPDST